MGIELFLQMTAKLRSTLKGIKKVNCYLKAVVMDISIACAIILMILAMNKLIDLN